MIDESRVVRRQLLEEVGDEMDIVRGGRATTLASLEVRSDNVDTNFELRGAPERMRLRGRKGIDIIGSSAGICRRGLRPKVDLRGADRGGAVTTVRIHDTAVTI